MNTEDADVDRYLKLLTLLETEEIIQILQEHAISPELRSGQKKLAHEVVKIIHGEKDAKNCEKVTEFLF
jgi:tyrosyl-tRNA synthetase